MRIAGTVSLPDIRDLTGYLPSNLIETSQQGQNGLPQSFLWVLWLWCRSTQREGFDQSLSESLLPRSPSATGMTYDEAHV